MYPVFQKSTPPTDGEIPYGSVSDHEEEEHDTDTVYENRSSVANGGVDARAGPVENAPQQIVERSDSVESSASTTINARQKDRDEKRAYSHGAMRDNDQRYRTGTGLSNDSSGRLGGANSISDDNTLRGEPRALPRYFLGSGYGNNSYFAKRLLNTMMFVSILDLAGILSFWLTDDISNGGLYVRNTADSLAFRKAECPEESITCLNCNTTVVYAMMCYHLLPAAILLGLPASGWRAVEPFKRQLREGRGHSKSKVKRSLYLQACELAAVIVLLLNAIVFCYFAYAFIIGENFNCNKTRVQLYTIGAVISFITMFIEITYFARFREHLKMQLGAFKEADQTGDVRARLASRSSSYHSERSRVVADIRKKLFRNAELGNLRELEKVLTFAQQRLGDDFPRELYPSARLVFQTFGKSKKNPMHIAAYHGNLAAMDLLFQAGFGVDEFDKVSRVRFSTGDLFWYFAQHFITKPSVLAGSSGEDTGVSIFRTTLVTPLHCAVATGQIGAVRWLLAHGSDVNIHSQSSFTSERVPPLFVAENPEIVNLLMQAGANHLEVPGPGRMTTLTVLQLAYLRGNIPVVEELEKWGGDVALTPLHTAAGLNDVKTVRSLLNGHTTGVGLSMGGADPNCLGEHGYSGLHRRTPLHWGAINGSYEAVELLLNAGADPNFQDVSGRTPLHWAARVNRAEVVKLLLTRKADPHIRDARHMTPILCAAQAAIVSKEVFEHLKDHGANINDEMRNGDTPLHLAMKSESQEAALTLVSCGANVMHVNSDGFRPVDCTTSTQLQFLIKQAAGTRDVMISYTHSHAEFARKLRKSLENANVTTWLDEMDPSGIGGGSVWREKIADGIRNAALVVCILTEDYANSEWCLKELALAKETGTPIMALSTERAPITEELQVYLYTRQIVPFESAIIAVDNSNRRAITYEYDEAKYSTQFRSLLDGVRDEIENRRKALIRRGMRRMGSTPSNTTLLDPAAVTELDLATITEDFVFIAHGDQHAVFVQRVYDRLTDSGVYCFLDSAHDHEDMQERIHVAKEAILQCACVIVIISRRTNESELVRDQLAFAEDKGKPILPIMLNDMELRPDKLYTLSRSTLLHFTPELGFNTSFAGLLSTIQQHVTSNAHTAGAGGPTAANVPAGGNARRWGGGQPSLLAVARSAAFQRLREKNPQLSGATEPLM